MQLPSLQAFADRLLLRRATVLFLQAHADYSRLVGVFEVLTSIALESHAQDEDAFFALTDEALPDQLRSAGQAEREEWEELHRLFLRTLETSHRLPAEVMRKCLSRLDDLLLLEQAALASPLTEYVHRELARLAR